MKWVQRCTKANNFLLPVVFFLQSSALTFSMQFSHSRPLVVWTRLQRRSHMRIPKFSVTFSPSSLTYLRSYHFPPLLLPVVLSISLLSSFLSLNEGILKLCTVGISGSYILLLKITFRSLILLKWISKLPFSQLLSTFLRFLYTCSI